MRSCWLKVLDILASSLGMNPSKWGRCSLRSLSFSLWIWSSCHLLFSTCLEYSSCYLSFSSLKARRRSCQSFSISRLCSCSFILRFCWASCSNLSSLANFYAIFLLNSASMRSSSSFWSLFLSLASLSALIISILCLSRFSAYSCYFRRIWASYSSW